MQIIKKLKPVIFALIIGILLAIASVIYSQAKSLKTAENSAQSSPSKISTSNCPWNDKVFCSFFQKLSDSEKYYPGSLTLKIKSRDASGAVTTASWSTDGKNNGHVTAQKDGKFVSDVILIEQKLYLKDNSANAWEEQDLSSFDSSLNFGVDISNIKKFILSKMTQKLTGAKIKLANREKCGEMECFRYLITVPGTASSSEYIYFDQGSYLLTKTTSQGSDGYSEESTLDRSVVNIKAPSPLK